MDAAMINCPNAGFSRRLAAMFYDGCLIVALYMAIGIALTGFLQTFMDQDMPTGWPATVLLCGVGGVFNIYFWMKGGQTLGMQVWRIKLIDDTGHKPDLASCVLRYVVAMLSLFVVFLGYLYMFLNPERLTLHDLASDTRMVYVGDRPLRAEMSTGVTGPGESKADGKDTSG